MTQRATDVVNRAFADEEIEKHLETIRSFLREGSELEEAVAQLAETLTDKIGNDLIMQVADEDLPVVRACVATTAIIFSKLLEQ